MTDFVPEPYFCEPRDTFTPAIFHGGHDCGGVLGPPFQTEMIGAKLECHVQCSHDSASFQNPFDRKTFCNKVIASCVFWCELSGPGEKSRFTMFCMSQPTGDTTTFFSAAKEFRAFRSEGGYVLKSNFFDDTNDHCIPSEDVKLDGDIATLTLKKNGKSVGLFPTPTISQVVAVDDKISVAGYPCRAENDDVANNYKQEDDTYGPQNMMLFKDDFVSMYQRIFGCHDRIVVANGFVRNDRCHAFYNTNVGMIGGPVFLNTDTGVTFIGVHLGLDHRFNLHRFALFEEN